MLRICISFHVYDIYDIHYLPGSSWATPIVANYSDQTWESRPQQPFSSKVGPYQLYVGAHTNRGYKLPNYFRLFISGDSMSLHFNTILKAQLADSHGAWSPNKNRGPERKEIGPSAAVPEVPGTEGDWI